MLAGKALKIQLHRGSQVQIFEIHGERALLGSGSHCDVRVKPAEAAVEHLAFDVHGDSVIATARSNEPPCMLNGVPFSEGRLIPGSILEIGELAIAIELVEVKLAAAKRKESSGLPLVVQVIGLAAVAAGLYFALQEEADGSAVANPVALPALFAEPRDGCPERDQTAARSLAAQYVLAADIKRERSPFYAGDGVQAVPLYDRAAACFAAAGDAAAAREAAESSKVLRSALSDSLRVRQVRLERFLAQAKYDEAQSEIRVLRDYVRHTEAPYVQWLSQVQREIDTQFVTAANQEGI